MQLVNVANFLFNCYCILIPFIIIVVILYLYFDIKGLYYIKTLSLQKCLSQKPTAFTKHLAQANMAILKQKNKYNLSHLCD